MDIFPLRANGLVRKSVEARINIHKSLPWLQRSVRSLTIYFLGTFTHSNKEVVDFLLDASWKCASAEVKLEWVSSLEGFVKALIKKSRTLATIKNAIPSIWFSCRENEGEGLQLNFLLLDPEVTKLEPPDSHNAEAAYSRTSIRRHPWGPAQDPNFTKKFMTTTMTHILQLEGFQKLNIATDGSKLDDVYDVVIKFSTAEASMSPRKMGGSLR
ncbi:hypothetical protein Ddc_17902 [Ditylenchus destructor]|nr:hypothetical protein Ddc_17902 [Ditylenchus destructor]